VQECGQFLEEAITEWLTRHHLGSQLTRHGYDDHVRLVTIMTLANPRLTRALERAYLDGDIRSFRNVLRQFFQGDGELTNIFLERAKNIGQELSDRDAYDDVIHLLQHRSEPPFHL
jgi:hypothetical protein